MKATKLEALEVEQNNSMLNQKESVNVLADKKTVCKSIVNRGLVNLNILFVNRNLQNCKKKC